MDLSYIAVQLSNFKTALAAFAELAKVPEIIGGLLNGTGKLPSLSSALQGFAK